MPKQIEINELFQKALDIMEDTGKNVFITGKAGTGKSTLLNYFRGKTQKRIVVLAPTGVAALNVRGETIHSFFNFKPGVTIQSIKKPRKKKNNIYKKLDAIIIDEISMVRSDLLNCVERFLSINGKEPEKPFGGIQMIFIGDLYQLPPVVTSNEKEIFESHYKSPYFFDADIFGSLPMEFIELEKIYRQKDEKFIRLLNAIRNNSITTEGLAFLNKRAGVSFKDSKDSGYVINLTTTNNMASIINEEHLNKLDTVIHTYEAVTIGDFKEQSAPTDYSLKLAVGAQVMLLNNDAHGRWVNGTIGEIKDIKRGEDGAQDVICVELSDGNIEEVSPYTWEIFHFKFNEKFQSIESESVGSFEQYPLKLAWAITIHKSQGKTFERVIIDMGRGAFAHGQTYVALSRCTSLDGISLSSPIKKSHIIMDWRIVKFLTKYQYAISEKNMPQEDKIKLIQEAIKNKLCLDIVYLKAGDEKSKRIIKPRDVGEKFYQNKSFIGVEAYCMERKEDRVFRVDRILEMKMVAK